MATSTGAEYWECGGCDTKCKVKLPPKPKDVSIPTIPFPKFPPEIKLPKLPTITKQTKFNFEVLCPSARRKD